MVSHPREVAELIMLAAQLAERRAIEQTFGTQEDQMNADVLTTRAADGIAVITLGSANRIYFDAEMGDALTEALDGFASDPKFRVVIVTGGAPGPNRGIPANFRSRVALFQSSF
jgi:hypothetical protein